MDTPPPPVTPEKAGGGGQPPVYPPVCVEDDNGAMYVLERAGRDLCTVQFSVLKQKLQKFAHMAPEDMKFVWQGRVVGDQWTCKSLPGFDPKRHALRLTRPTPPPQAAASASAAADQTPQSIAESVTPLSRPTGNTGNTGTGAPQGGGVHDAPAADAKKPRDRDANIIVLTVVPLGKPNVEYHVSAKCASIEHLRVDTLEKALSGKIPRGAGVPLIFTYNGRRLQDTCAGYDPSGLEPIYVTAADDGKGAPSPSQPRPPPPMVAQRQQSDPYIRSVHEPDELSADTDRDEVEHLSITQNLESTGGAGAGSGAGRQRQGAAGINRVASAPPPVIVTPTGGDAFRHGRRRYPVDPASKTMDLAGIQREESHSTQSPFVQPPPPPHPRHHHPLQHPHHETFPRGASAGTANGLANPMALTHTQYQPSSLNASRGPSASGCVAGSPVRAGCTSQRTPDTRYLGGKVQPRKTPNLGRSGPSPPPPGAGGSPPAPGSPYERTVGVRVEYVPEDCVVRELVLLANNRDLTLQRGKKLKKALALRVDLAPADMVLSCYSKAAGRLVELSDDEPLYQTNLPLTSGKVDGGPSGTRYFDEVGIVHLKRRIVHDPRHGTHLVTIMFDQATEPLQVVLPSADVSMGVLRERVNIETQLRHRFQLYYGEAVCPVALDDDPIGPRRKVFTLVPIPRMFDKGKFVGGRQGRKKHADADLCPSDDVTRTARTRRRSCPDDTAMRRYHAVKAREPRGDWAGFGFRLGFWESVDKSTPSKFARGARALRACRRQQPAERGRAHSRADRAAVWRSASAAALPSYFDSEQRARILGYRTPAVLCIPEAAARRLRRRLRDADAAWRTRLQLLPAASPRARTSPAGSHGNAAGPAGDVVPPQQVPQLPSPRAASAPMAHAHRQVPPAPGVQSPPPAHNHARGGSRGRLASHAGRSSPTHTEPGGSERGGGVHPPTRLPGDDSALVSTPYDPPPFVPRVNASRGDVDWMNLAYSVASTNAATRALRGLPPAPNGPPPDRSEARPRIHGDRGPLLATPQAVRAAPLHKSLAHARAVPFAAGNTHAPPGLEQTHPPPHPAFAQGGGLVDRLTLIENVVDQRRLDFKTSPRGAVSPHRWEGRGPEAYHARSLYPPPPGHREPPRRNRDVDPPEWAMIEGDIRKL